MNGHNKDYRIVPMHEVKCFEEKISTYPAFNWLPGARKALKNWNDCVIIACKYSSDGKKLISWHVKEVG